jgi:S-adenosyl methyltransferase
VARVYDYWLGGSHNFLADQDLARAMSAVEPNMRAAARANRAFLGRAVRFLASAGIAQFLDIGSGIPTEGNVHEIAQQASPGARVVYADIDPVAVAHSQAILAGNPGAGVTQADLRKPEQILAHETTGHLVDFGQPAGAAAGDGAYPAGLWCWACVVARGATHSRPATPGKELTPPVACHSHSPIDNLRRGFRDRS